MNQLHRIKFLWMLIAPFTMIVLDLLVTRHNHAVLWLDQVALAIIIFTGMQFYYDCHIHNIIRRKLLVIPVVTSFLFALFYSLVVEPNIIYSGAFIFIGTGILAFEFKMTKRMGRYIRLGIGLSILAFTLNKELSNPASFPVIDEGVLPIRAFYLAFAFGGSLIFVFHVGETYWRSIRLSIQKSSQRISFQKDLFSILAHNIRTPMSALLMELELTRMRGEEYLPIERTEEVIDRLNHTVTSLLNQNRVANNEKLLNLGEAIRDLQISLSGQTRWTINCDPKKQEVHYGVILAFENFLSNALKYDSHPEVEIDIKNGLSLTITDQGPGMTEEAFRSYGQPVVSTSGGLGIGIHLSLDILKDLGYRCVAATTPGEGMIVQIYESKDDHLLPVPKMKHVRELA